MILGKRDREEFARLQHNVARLHQTVDRLHEVIDNSASAPELIWDRQTADSIRQQGIIEALSLVISVLRLDDYIDPFGEGDQILDVGVPLVEEFHQDLLATQRARIEDAEIAAQERSVARIEALTAQAPSGGVRDRVQEAFRGFGGYERGSGDAHGAEDLVQWLKSNVSPDVASVVIFSSDSNGNEEEEK